MTNSVACTIVPWTKKGEPVVIAKRHGRSLVSQIFTAPDGVDHEFTLVIQKNWSVVLPVTADGNVVVVSEYKQGRHSVGDELPAGTAGVTQDDDTPEAPEVVARRELLEETGYEAYKMIPLGIMHMATRNSPTVGHCFLATGCKKVAEGKIDRSEIIEAREVKMVDWLRMIARGDITEPSAVVATVRALPHLLRPEIIEEHDVLSGLRG